MARGEEDLNVPLAGMLRKMQVQAQRPHQTPIPAQLSDDIPSTSRACLSGITVNNVAMTSSAKATSSSGGLPNSPKRNEPSSSSQQNFNSAFRVATIPSGQHESLLKSLELWKEEDRLVTFTNWPMQPRTVNPKDLARSGFFYLGNQDRVQCFSCGGIARNWCSGDFVEEEHKKLFPHCRMILKSERRNVPLTEETNSPQDCDVTFTNNFRLTEEQRRNLLDMFPCHHAVNAHMRNEDARYETFDSRWPQNRVRATPRQISEAGFYFLGERDRAKCWYCNGGLQNWEPNDDPWFEHAKWFPTCEYLLQSRGPEFVHSVVSAFPNLRRPQMSGQLDTHSQRERQRSPSPPLMIVDPQAERATLTEELNNAMASDIVKTAGEMGFEVKSIRRCVLRKLQTNNNTMYQSADELLEDLLTGGQSEEESDESEHEMEVTSNSLPPIVACSATPPPSFQMQQESSSPSEESPLSSESMHSLQEQIREMKQERRCKICLDRTAQVVFIPCGHLCSCMDCAPALRLCPICRVKIAKAIRTYQT